jgi:outer membrane protein W
MKAVKHILTLGVAILMAASCFGKASLKKHHIHLKDMHIGFYQGATILDVSRNMNISTRKVTAATTGVTFGFPFVTQFRSEVGLSMNNLLLNNKKSGILAQQNSYLSIPVTVQYYILPKKSKIQPYFGFGAMVVPDADKLLFTRSSDGVNLLQGPGVINMLITQGVNIEINTHIRLTESLHIMSSEGRTSYGVNLGVNLYMP